MSARQSILAPARECRSDRESRSDEGILVLRARSGEPLREERKGLPGRSKDAAHRKHIAPDGRRCFAFPRQEIGPCANPLMG